MGDVYGDQILNGLISLVNIAEKTDHMLVLTMLRCGHEQLGRLKSAASVSVSAR